MSIRRPKPDPRIVKRLARITWGDGATSQRWFPAKMDRFRKGRER